MSISPARASAFDILLQVEKEDAYASELLHSVQNASLSAEDHGLATQIVMGVLRWRSQLDAELAPFSKWPLAKLDAEVLTALRMGAYQLTRLDRVPAHAAVHESVELVKRSRRTSAAGLVNALLRKIGASRQSVPSPDNCPTPQRPSSSVLEIAADYAHPEWLVTRWVAAFGMDLARAICSASQRVPPTTIRIRDLTAAAPFDLVGEGVQISPGSLLSCARRVDSGDITKTHAYHSGRIVIQDEASQLVALLVGQGERILDACAAPGGKTMILVERNPNSTIIAADLHPHRTRLLAERVQAPNLTIVTTDLRKLPAQEKFDRILLDAPCTGTGTLAHHPEIKWRLRGEDIPRMQQLQVELLLSALRHLSDGGRLLYSTCSLEPEECEQVIERALADPSLAAEHAEVCDLTPDLLQLQSGKVLTTPHMERLLKGPYLRTFPGIHPCDGFFAAMIRKD